MSAVIRFQCPNCGRRYELPDALTGLPLLCKGCGQALTAPAPGPELPPEPEPEPAPVPVPIPKRPEPQLPEKPAPAAEPDQPSDIPLDVIGPPAAPDAPASPEPVIVGPPLPAAVRWPGVRKYVPAVADAAVGLVLLVAGVVLGEFLAGQPTGQVLREAKSSPRFPSTELLLWLAPVVSFGLGYTLLAARKWTVGEWLRRRGGAAGSRAKDA